MMMMKIYLIHIKKLLHSGNDFLLFFLQKKKGSHTQNKHTHAQKKKKPKKNPSKK